MIEFLPESVDNDAEEELLSGPGGKPGRWLVAGGVVAVGALVAGLVSLARLGHDGPAPSIPTSAPSPSVERTVTVDEPPGPRNLPGLPHLPVYGLAVLGDTTWVLQRDGLHVLRPGQPPATLPRQDRQQTWETARVMAEPDTNEVWLVTQRRAWAYTPDLRTVFTGPVPPFSDIAVLGGRLFLAGGSELVEVGPGVRGARQIFEAPGPLATVAADPSRQRLLVAYLSGSSRLFALQPTPHGLARVLRSSSVRTINATLAVADGAIWLAGFSTGAGSLMRLDPNTLRPDLHFAYASSLGSGAVLVAEGRTSVWVREGLGGPDLRCIDARTGAQAQTWQLDGLVSSTSGRAVLGTGSGAARLALGGCSG